MMKVWKYNDTTIESKWYRDMTIKGTKIESDTTIEGTKIQQLKVQRYNNWRYKDTTIDWSGFKIGECLFNEWQ